MPKAYKYNKTTKKYEGEIERQRDPLESEKVGYDVWLMPANATDVLPLEPKDGFDVVWNSGVWIYQEVPLPEPRPEPMPYTREEISLMRAEAYRMEVDPITSHISRLRDAEQPEEIIAEISELIAERDTKVAEIKERFPYPAE